MARTAWFLAYLVGAYVIAWAGFFLLGLDQLAGRFSAWLATLLLDMATPAAVASEMDAKGVTFILESGHEVLHDTRFAGQSLPLLFAVVIAVSRHFDRRTFTLLGGGLVAILLLDGLALSGQVWAEFGEALPTNAAYHVLRIFSIWSDGGWSFAPVFIAGLLAMNTGDPSTEKGRAGLWRSE
jgi:hypothetical protein